MEPQSGGRLGEHQVIEGEVQSIARFTGLASDSREVKPGYLFAALPGARADGRAFIADAIARGATTVLGHPRAREAAESLGVTFLADEHPRAALARIAAKFFGAGPETIAAVTGTNGKTSVAVFLRQIWARLGHGAASMGTIGVVAPTGAIALSHTTPDPIETHRLLADLAANGVDHLALEASSHGLDQCRLDGVTIAAAGFTNLTRDHLDYHADFSAYRDAKLRLFSELVEPGGLAVINADADCADEFISAARKRGLDVLSVGAKGEGIRLLSRDAHGDGQTLKLAHGGREFDVTLPLAGDFQAANALVAAGLAIGLGDPANKVFAALEQLKGAAGRLEKVATVKSGASIYVDYAHTPDALETVLKAIRPHVVSRLSVVFGCGGDRDRGKRPLMGEAAATLADNVIVTDDNPRSEDPATIRAEILTGCANAKEIGDRAEAIRTAIAALQTGDVLVIAGKGHEQGQIIGLEARPFCDRDEAVKSALALGGQAVPA